MRKTWRSRKTECTTSWSERAEARSVPNGFSITARTSPCSDRCRPFSLIADGDDGEELRRRREVVDAVERLAGLGVELVHRLAQARVAGHVVERDAEVAHAAEQARRAAASLGRAAGELADRLARLRAEVVVGEIAARDADQVEALRQRALVSEVVERRQELAPRQVARRTEDDQRRGRDRETLQAFDERVLGRRDRHQPPPAARSTAWPPNWLRRAASILCV